MDLKACSAPKAKISTLLNNIVNESVWNTFAIPRPNNGFSSLILSFIFEILYEFLSLKTINEDWTIKPINSVKEKIWRRIINFSSLYSKKLNNKKYPVNHLIIFEIKSFLTALNLIRRNLQTSDRTIIKDKK